MTSPAMLHFAFHRRRRTLPSSGVWCAWAAVAVALAGPTWQVGLAQQNRDVGLEKPGNAPVVTFNIGGHIAPVRVLEFTHDSRRLLSAGLDKVVHVSRVSETKKGLHVEAGRPLRWEAVPGKEGTIYAMATHPDENTVAFAGLSARGKSADILFADAVTGRFLHHEKPIGPNTHAGRIRDLGYSADGTWLASVDTAGRVLVRRRKEPSELLQGADGQSPGVRTLAMAGNEKVIWPTRHGNYWHLTAYDLERRRAEVLGQKHHGAVAALAASSDGSYLVSADMSLSIYLTDLRTGRTLKKWSLIQQTTAEQVLSLAFSADGEYLAVGTLVGRKGRVNGSSQLVEPITGRIRLWQLGARGEVKVVRQRDVADPVYACAISRDGRYLAYTGADGHAVTVERVGQATRAATLAGGTRLQQIALVTGGADGGPAETPAVVIETAEGRRKRFDPRKPDVEDANPNLQEARRRNLFAGWTAEIKPQLVDGRMVDVVQLVDPRGQSHTLAVNAFPPNEQYVDATCFCLLPDQDGRPQTIAVGTDEDYGMIFLYRLADLSGDRPVRIFSGHVAAVNDLIVSRDGDHLISCSDDGTARYWNLRPLRHEDPVARRWGVHLVSDQGVLRVKQIDPDSPLFHNGVSVGDELTAVRVGVSETDVQGADAIYRMLQQVDWYEQVGFFFDRQGEHRPVFVTPPSWPDLLSVFLAGNSWISWAYDGSYECSPDGERLMGWLVLNEYGQPPTFRTASDLHEKLHRPEVIRNLFARAEPPPDDGGEIAVAPPIRPRPVDIPNVVVRITSPEMTSSPLEVIEDTITIRGEAIPERGEVEKMQLLINGSLKPDTLRAIEAPGALRTRQWTVPLKPGQPYEFKVKATCEGAEAESAPLIVQYQPGQGKQSLRLLAIGIGKAYPVGDRLEYPARDANRVEEAFSHLAGPPLPYDEVPAPRLLTEESATKQKIRRELKTIVGNMNDHDVTVVFFAGHGRQYTDEKGQTDFYLAPSNYDPEDVPGTCISATYLKEEFFGRLAGRGTVIFMLDACHAGQLRETAVDDLARELRRDEFGVLFMGACGADQEALEHVEFGGGLFTHVLVSGLRDERAELNGDEMIDTDELRRHLKEWVPELASDKHHVQDPVFNDRGALTAQLTQLPKQLSN